MIHSPAGIIRRPPHTYMRRTRTASLRRAPRPARCPRRRARPRRRAPARPQTTPVSTPRATGMAAIFSAMRSSAGALARTTLTPRWRARGIEGLIGRVGLPSGRVRTWSTWSADCSRFPPGPTMWPGRSSSPDAPRLRSWSAAGANGVLQPAAVVDAQRRAPKSE
jgi:hypothetical protein